MGTITSDDKDRANAVGETIWREMDRRHLLDPTTEAHNYLRGDPFIDFMTGVFRAIRGERD